MIIHFTAARESVVDNIDTMRKIISIIHETGHVLSRDWLEPFYILAQKQVGGLSPKQIYKLNIDAINRADVLVVEGSKHSFSSGFQIALALHKKKPVLLLINKTHNDEGYMSKGINDVFLKRVEYSDGDLEKNIKRFIVDNAVSTKDLRFNFVIDRKIYHHLNKRSYSLGKTKAEIVRDLLVDDMERDV